jgi:hypothetical protein
MKNHLLFVCFLIIVLISCNKTEQTTSNYTNYKLEVCDFPNVKEQNKIIDTTFPPLSILDSCELCNPQPDIAIMLVVFKSTRIQTPYWNSGRGFTTKQIVYDTNIMKKIVHHVNNSYFPWRVRFTLDSIEFSQFSGFKEIVHVTSNYVRTDNQSSDNLLFNAPVGGVSYVGVLYDNEIHHSFVFADVLGSIRNVVSTTVHESGHSIGLNHQSSWTSTCSFISTYRPNCWMGNSLSPYSGGWEDGPTPYGCNIIQSDTAILNFRLGRKYVNLIY